MVYLNSLSDVESAFTEYIVKYLDLPVEESNKTRIQKILVYVAEKTNFPLTRAWYKYGYTSAAPDNILFRDTSDINNLFDKFTGTIKNYKQKDFNKIIDDGKSIYNQKTTEEIRRKQYEIYDQKIYFSILNIQNSICNKLSQNSLQLITKDLVVVYCNLEFGFKNINFKNSVYQTIILLKRTYKINNFTDYNLINEIIHTFMETISAYISINTAKGLSKQQLITKEETSFKKSNSLLKPLLYKLEKNITTTVSKNILTNKIMLHYPNLSIPATKLALNER